MLAKSIQLNGGSVEKVVKNGDYMYMVTKENRDKPIESHSNHFVVNIISEITYS